MTSHRAWRWSGEMTLRFDETISTAGTRHERFDPLIDSPVARGDIPYIRWQKNQHNTFYDVSGTSMRPPQEAFI
jgi:hypothetical protein